MIIVHDDQTNPIDEAVAHEAYDRFGDKIRDDVIEQVIDWMIGIRRAAYLAGFADGRKVRS